MSSAYCKELLQDMALNKVPLDTKADLLNAIRELYLEKILKPRDVLILNYYLSGFSIQEIAPMFSSYSKEIEDVLDRTITAIAYSSNYTDDFILQRVQMSKQPRSKKENAKKVLERIAHEY